VNKTEAKAKTSAYAAENGATSILISGALNWGVPTRVLKIMSYWVV